MTFTFALDASGDESTDGLETGIPVLGGEPREVIMGAAAPAGKEDILSLWRGEDGLVGISRTDPRDNLEGAVGRVYSDILHAARGLNLYRIWNFIPRINEEGPGGLENYRAFCRGRSLAFESGLGKDFLSSLPAASGVGSAGSELVVVFLAGPEPTRHFENPEQVPAYMYPAEHGPRPPSFARATTVKGKGGMNVFVSGTSAIMGHSTVSPHDTAGQLDCTLENLRLISRACGLGDNLAAGTGCSRHFKVYLRNAGDLPAVALELDRRMLSPGDRVSYLGADICRSALNVEIEVAVRGVEST